MQTQGLGRTLKGHETQVAGLDARPAQAGRATMGRLGAIAFVVGTAVGSWSAWGMTQLVNSAAVSAPAAPVAPAPGHIARTTTHAPSGARSVVMSVPRDGDYLKATSIPVAGFAAGRPHGPSIKSVHVELLVGDRVIDSADIEVFSGRFAGVLSASDISGRAAAVLRITNPARSDQPIVAKKVTIDRR